MMIPFNKPYITGNELQYMMQAVQSGKISGDGMFSERCHAFFQEKFGFERCYLTTSCTDALEMIALLLNIGHGDEVIIPSFSFVSLANAFVLRGADIVFIDSNSKNPNIDVEALEGLITPRTKVIAPIHYAGIAADMDRIIELCQQYDLFLIEDAAQAIDSKFKDKPLGSIGDLGAMSFHETKNIISGEGGLLIVNNDKYIERAEIIREKGTNRSQFFRGEIDKYCWIDIGSSFLPSDLVAAFLYAQLENINSIQTRRAEIWNRYYEALKPLGNDGKLILPHIPDFATNNYHIFYFVCETPEVRTKLMRFLAEKGVNAVFHYQPLHLSPYFKDKYKGPELTNSVRYGDCLLRLPMYYELTPDLQDEVIDSIIKFYQD